jgi:AraC family transcriptional regulator
MILTPEIKLISKKILVGIQRRMSLSKNEIPLLWKAFLPRRNEIPDVIGSILYSVEVYDNLSYFFHFDPAREFDKWAAVEVSSAGEIPDEMKSLIIPEGTYAVFTYKGSGQDVYAFYAAIFSQWLPASKYSLDNRPHFAAMGEKYKKGDPDSEEEIYIPIKVRDTN